MYIQIVYKGDKIYYSLCVNDNKDKDKWVSHWLSYAEYMILKNMYKVKEIRK